MNAQPADDPLPYCSISIEKNFPRADCSCKEEWCFCEAINASFTAPNRVIEGTSLVGHCEVTSELIRHIVKERLPKAESITEGWIQMYEILSRENFFSHEMVALQAVHISELQGDYIRAFHHYIRAHIPGCTYNWRGISYDPTSETSIPVNHSINFFLESYDHWVSHGSVTDYASLAYFGSVLREFKPCVITGTGTMTEEALDCRVLLSELLIATQILALGGTFVQRLTNADSDYVILLLATSKSMFTEVKLIRPSVGTGYYMLCTGFQTGSERGAKYLKHLVKTISMNPNPCCPTLDGLAPDFIDHCRQVSSSLALAQRHKLTAKAAIIRFSAHFCTYYDISPVANAQLFAAHFPPIDAADTPGMKIDCDHLVSIVNQLAAVRKTNYFNSNCLVWSFTVQSYNSSYESLMQELEFLSPCALPHPAHEIPVSESMNQYYRNTLINGIRPVIRPYVNMYHMRQSFYCDPGLFQRATLVRTLLPPTLVPTSITDVNPNSKLLCLSTFLAHLSVEPSIYSDASLCAIVCSASSVFSQFYEAIGIQNVSVNLGKCHIEGSIPAHKLQNWPQLKEALSRVIKSPANLIVFDIPVYPYRELIENDAKSSVLVLKCIRFLLQYIAHGGDVLFHLPIMLTRGSVSLMPILSLLFERIHIEASLFPSAINPTVTIVCKRYCLRATDDIIKPLYSTVVAAITKYEASIGTNIPLALQYIFPPPSSAGTIREVLLSVNNSLLNRTTNILIGAIRKPHKFPIEFIKPDGERLTVISHEVLGSLTGSIAVETAEKMETEILSTLKIDTLMENRRVRDYANAYKPGLLRFLKRINTDFIALPLYINGCLNSTFNLQAILCDSDYTAWGFKLEKSTKKLQLINEELIATSWP